VKWVRTTPPLRLQPMKRQRGSCSPAGRLTPNPHLVKAPRACIDYVIVHELCHLREQNHGPAFHRLLDTRGCPAGARPRRGWTISSRK
jgi:predicted metal-dependent hydrolase